MTTRVVPQLIDQSQGIGYTTGVGASVTQETSKATAVTINAPCGAINTHNAELTAGARVTFAVNNSAVTISDLVVAHVQGNGPGDSSRYRANVTYSNNGVFYITLESLAAVPHSDVVNINFAVIKSVVN